VLVGEIGEIRWWGAPPGAETTKVDAAVVSVLLVVESHQVSSFRPPGGTSCW
jgi:hypothetical protein